jgi:hypothetical protein
LADPTLPRYGIDFITNVEWLIRRYRVLVLTSSSTAADQLPLV